MKKVFDNVLELIGHTPLVRINRLNRGGAEVLVSIEELEVLEGSMPSKQLKMLLGWAAFHQEELRENWELARNQQELFSIEPLR